MAFKERIKGWMPLLPTSFVSRKFPLLADARFKIEKLLGTIQPKPPTVENLEEVYKIIQEHFADRNTLNGLSPRYLRRAPWILFSLPHNAPGELGRNKSFTLNYLNWIASQRTSNAANALLTTFLKEYPISIQTFDLWRKGIKELLKNTKNSILRLAKNRCNKFYLLEKDGPQRFCELLLNSKMDPDDLLTEAGLTGQLGIQGFIFSAYMNLLQKIYQSLNTGQTQPELLNKLFKLSKSNEEGDNKNNLRFSRGAKELAETLLLPYAEGKAPMAHRENIQNFLVTHLGDPRIKKTGWVGINEKAMQIIFSWLVEITLDVFFQLLDATADTIWKYRKSFWDAYYKRGYIRDAWAILGKDAISIAKRISDKKIFFGQLAGSYSHNQSVLLMRIDNLIIAEWSHNGKCRIWEINEKNEKIIPKLYNNDSPYNAADLRCNADLEQVHYSSKTGTWQKKVEGFIRRHTNIKIAKEEYMPQWG
ncbi:EH signature domain-containing protein [Desulfovulcanus sp.]